LRNPGFPDTDAQFSLPFIPLLTAKRRFLAVTAVNADGPELKAALPGDVKHRPAAAFYFETAVYPPIAPASV